MFYSLSPVLLIKRMKSEKLTLFSKKLRIFFMLDFFIFLEKMTYVIIPTINAIPPIFISYPTTPKTTTADGQFDTAQSAVVVFEVYGRLLGGYLLSLL